MSDVAYAVGADELPYADFRLGHYCDSCDERCNEPVSCKDFDCERESLCVGCAFSCADCGRDFCEEHIVRVWSVERPGMAHHFCDTCYSAKTGAVMATTEEELKARREKWAQALESGE